MANEYKQKDSKQFLANQTEQQTGRIYSGDMEVALTFENWSL